MELEAARRVVEASRFLIVTLREYGEIHATDGSLCGESELIEAIAEYDAARLSRES